MAQGSGASASLARRIDAFTKRAKGGHGTPATAYPASAAAKKGAMLLEPFYKEPPKRAQLGSVYWVPVDELAKAEPRFRSSWWLDALTLRPKQAMPGASAGGGGGNEPAFDVYYERPGWLGVPRFFGLSHFGAPAAATGGGDCRVQGDAMSEAAAASFRWHADPARNQPRPPQAVALERCLPALRKWGGTTVEMACGEGKSCLAVRLATLLGRKALVVVPTRTLLKQWRGAMGRHCPEAAVAEMTCKYDPVRHDAAVAEADVVVTTSHSLARVGYPQKLLRTFGTVVVDEAHTIASRTLSQVLPLLPARYVLGLTATPERRDELGYALPWLLGPCVFRYQRVQQLTQRAHAVEVRQVPVEGVPGLPHAAVTRGDGEVLWLQSLQRLAKSEARNRLVVRTVLGAIGAIGGGGATGASARPRDRAVVLTKLVDHAEALCGLFRQELGEGLVEVVTGKLPQKEQAARLKNPAMKVLVGTIQLLGTGFDDPMIDTVALAMPVGALGDALQQAIGRSERARPGKQRPLVLDFVDRFAPFSNMAISRRRFYGKFSWKVTQECQGSGPAKPERPTVRLALPPPPPPSSSSRPKARTAAATTRRRKKRSERPSAANGGNVMVQTKLGFGKKARRR